MKFKLVPMMLVVAGLAFAVRVGDFVTGLNTMGSAMAQQEVNVKPPPIPITDIGSGGKEHDPVVPEIAPMEAIKGRLDLDAKGEGVQLKPEFETKFATPPPESELKGTKDSSATTSVAEPSMDHGEEVTWKDSTDSDIEDSAVRDELYKDLAKRRDTLDKKEKELGVREALLSAAERELDQKLRELTNLRNEIDASMKKRSDEEEARVVSLVKIYEGMKPKDAASILNTLDLDVLLVIMTKMSERKSSPIMAQMNPDRARTLTIMMSEQQRTPTLPDIK